MTKQNRTTKKTLRDTALYNEWYHLKTSRILIVSVIVMLFIPIMYGGFFLGSIWDPYGNTKNLPVAVVNNDKGATLKDKKVAVGDELVNTLKDEHSFEWHFVSEDKADKGLDNGSYYMKIVIPENASENVTTITSDTPSKTTIAYTTTPSRNYIASLLTNQAAQTIAQSVSTKITTAYAQSILEQIGELKTGLNTAADGATQLSNGSAQLQSGIRTYTGGVAKVHNGIEQLSAGLPTASQIAQLSDGVKSVQSGVNALNNAVSTPSGALVAQQTLVQSDAAALQAALVNYQTAASSAQPSLAALQTALAAGTSTVTVNSSDISAALQIVSASQTITQKSASLLTNLNTLTAMLTAQQATLKSSVATLNTGVNTLTPGLLSAVDGYTTLASGSSQLLAGTNQLSASSAALNDGATQISDGSARLASALTSAAQQVSVQPTGEATAKQLAQPVDTHHSETAHVPNYGYALSPYVLSLGLYVGALVFNVIYPVRRLYANPRNSRSWWYAKMSVAFAVAIGQALVLDAIMVIGLGLHPDQPGKFILLSIVTSMTYMSIVSFLAIALDNIGRFLAMLLLVLQLSAAGGVFPILLSSGFFQAVNPLMPMTYSIYGFREAISSGLGAGVYWSSLLILVAIGVVANLMLITAFRIHGNRRFQHESIDT
ncbi:hypothetical protein BGO18_04535 [Candidatus Saccharibacteria bacterium 47-87]|nr:YhgE/Pip domain-containing protein [Candidatus Saccharibacteria bacterium]OJU97396.1 MAG: hypothetical protein BGO18_04535 [Candidatus Saccharibacteria bacterium 47-87]